jgi:hypothetical protein
MVKPVSARDAAPEARLQTAAEVLFRQSLSAHNINYFFANLGTDFPQIVDSCSRTTRSDVKLPCRLFHRYSSLQSIARGGVSLHSPSDRSG